jgi:hypothetical protein
MGGHSVFSVRQVRSNLQEDRRSFPIYFESNGGKFQHIVAYRPIVRQQPRNKRDNNRCYTATIAPMDWLGSQPVANMQQYMSYWNTTMNDVFYAVCAQML